MLTALNDELCDPQRFAAALLKHVSDRPATAALVGDPQRFAAALLKRWGCRSSPSRLGVVIRSDSLRPY